MEMITLFYLSVILLVGFVSSKIFGKLKFPDVTGYLIGGILIGPSVLNIIPHDAVQNFDILSEVALAFIAFSIGSELRFDQLKKIGMGIFLITVLEALVAFLLVTLSMLALKQSFAFSLAIGSIACATAPAATLMVIKQYKAEGPVVRTLIPVVALDDGVCIIAFGVASTIAQNIIKGGELGLFNMIIKPFGQIILALAIGFLAGIILVKLIDKVKLSSEVQIIMVGVIFALAAVTLKFDLSSLLTIMAFGTTLCNFGNGEIKAFNAIDNISAPVFLSFFVLSGADLKLSALKDIGVLGLAYMIARVSGKWLGASIGARVSKMPKTVQEFLGFCLIPQTGVAIGLSLIAERIIPGQHGVQIRAIILAATVLYAIIGPIATKFALIGAKEIKKENL